MDVVFRSDPGVPGPLNPRVDDPELQICSFVAKSIRRPISSVCDTRTTIGAVIPWNDGKPVSTKVGQSKTPEVRKTSFDNARCACRHRPLSLGHCSGSEGDADDAIVDFAHTHCSAV
jgi:hypothetical protein